MMAGFVDRVFTVGMVMPDLVGEKLELIVAGPVIESLFRDISLAVNFLEQNDVSIDLTNRFFDAMEDELAVGRVEPLVDIVG